MIRSLCQFFDLQSSGSYAWLRNSKSARQRKEDKLSGLIKQTWLESGCGQGYRKIHRDLQDSGERYGINHIHKLMQLDSIRTQVGYRKTRQRAGEAYVVTPSILAREFNPSQPINHGLLI